MHGAQMGRRTARRARVGERAARDNDTFGFVDNQPGGKANHLEAVMNTFFLLEDIEHHECNIVGIRADCIKASELGLNVMH